MENRLRTGFQLLGNHGLGDSIGDSGYPQHSGPTAMRFRYFHCPHRGWKVGPRRHPIPDPVEIVLQILLEILDGLPVHTCGALLRLDALVRLPHGSLRYLKRLVFWIRLTHSSPPRNPLVARVTKSRMSQPLRSAPITGASSLLRAGPPARSHRYSTSHSFCCSTHSLSPRPTITDGRSIDTRLPTFCAEAAVQAHAACMPDTAWPVSGSPPGSSRDRIDTPVLMSVHESRHFISGSLAFVFLNPHLTALTLPFPRRSLRRSSANAARGGLTPPTAGRRRRATSPPSSAQHRTDRDNSYMVDSLSALVAQQCPSVKNSRLFSLFR